jgi:hypothetical protein
VGNAAGRVLAGAGTVTTSVTVCVSGSSLSIITGGSSCEKMDDQQQVWRR